MITFLTYFHWKYRFVDWELFASLSFGAVAKAKSDTLLAQVKPVFDIIEAYNFLQILKEPTSQSFGSCSTANVYVQEEEEEEEEINIHTWSEINNIHENRRGMCNECEAGKIFKLKKAIFKHFSFLFYLPKEEVNQTFWNWISGMKRRALLRGVNLKVLWSLRGDDFI